MHSTIYFPYLHWNDAMVKKANWTSEFWLWLKGPGSVIIAIFASLFIAGKIYGGDTADMRNALALHTTQLQVSTTQSQTLNTSINELTKATQDVNKRQDATQSAMVEIIRVMIPMIRSAESRQHMKEVMESIRKVSELEPYDRAKGTLYITEHQ